MPTPAALNQFANTLKQRIIANVPDAVLNPQGSTAFADAPVFPPNEHGLDFETYAEVAALVVALLRQRCEAKVLSQPGGSLAITVARKPNRILANVQGEQQPVVVDRVEQEQFGAVEFTPNNTDTPPTAAWSANFTKAAADRPYPTTDNHLLNP